ncbi:MAG TPA: protein O-GlcNAcase [Acidimicrobiia bacterium]|nr:protein O-GlcNAcase [Acidimicrobiia bacterium]
MSHTVRWLSVPPEIDREHLDGMARQCGLTVADRADTNLTVAVTLSADPDLTYDSAHRRISDETYILRLGEEGHAGLDVTGSRSLRWGLVDLAGKAGGEDWESGERRQSPGFGIRGIIEGFYGPPWEDQARLDMIDFASRHRFNTFFYSPKDDPYLRRDWRTPFEGKSLRRLEEVIERCRDRDIDSMIGVSPGLSMRYSDDKDNDLLAEKISSLIDLGATSIALLFDDIPDRLQHDADLSTFPDLAAAHAQTANRVFDGIAGPFVVCPTIYWGAGDEEYISRLGDQVDPRIDLFWTGRAVCSPAITVTEAAHFARVNRRPPLYWDNYPVNDASMANEMHIGPFQNRDGALDRFCRGLMANAMEYPEASKIGLATIADYLWDPVGYDPETSWQRAIVEIAGVTDAPALSLFADTVRASCLSDPDPLGLTAALQAYAFQIESGHPRAAATGLAAYGLELTGAADHLLGRDMENRVLQAELAPWLAKFRSGAEAVTAIAARRGEGDLTESLKHLREDPRRVFGDVLEMTLADLIK